MNKEKEIEEIVKHTCNREGIAKRCPQRITEALVAAGYGNVKQAVKEFAEKLKAEINALPKDILTCSLRHQAPKLIDNTFKELYGEEEE